jgi:Uma2 family endonuclease
MARVLVEAPLGIEDRLDHAGEPERRYELIESRLVAMNPPDEWHGVIANEIGRLCAEALRDCFPCRVQQQAGIEIRREPKATGYIADLAVTCEPIAENRPLMEAPRLVVEVVSPSTDRFDKTSKLDAFMDLPTLEEIWLVWSTNRLVLVARREPTGWSKPEAFIGRARFESCVLGVTVALDEIYRFAPFG